MKLLLLIPVMAGLAAVPLAAADSATAKTARPASVPAAAVEISPGSYRFTDKQGTNWIYRVTPFGVARFEDKPPAEQPVPAKEIVRAREEGDSIFFERPGPFGMYRWQRKKSELTDDERALWERAQADTARK